jgi:acetyl-CoA carboxylase carboxyltransferase component
MDFKQLIKKLNLTSESGEELEIREKQHQKGKLSARERINLLLDPESFLELDPFVESRFNILGMEEKKRPGDGVIVGFGKINNRQVFLYSQDFTLMGGSLGEMQAEKIVKVMKLAQKTGCPIIGLIDSGGARIQEGVASLDGYAKIFKLMTELSGVVPQITVILGPAAGGAAYSPGLSDFVFMVKGISQMYITGPEVIKAVSGEKVSLEELGGTEVHSQESGCCHFVFENEKSCLEGVKKLLSFLPQNNLEDPPRQRRFLELLERENLRLLEIVPTEETKSYNMKEVIREIFDRNSFFEVQAHFAPSAIVGFATLAGWPCGVIANQPKYLAGTLDVDSSDKIARFVRFCDAFNIPLINLVDIPGYLPGKDQEKRGIIRHGSKVLYAFSEARVPKIALILRKAFGGAYIALCSRYLGFDKVIAWPTAQLAVMGPEQAVKIIYKKEIAEAEDPKKVEKEKIKEYKEIFLNPKEAAKMGQIDLIINPKDTRTILIKCLEALRNKRETRLPKKHGNIPL